MARTVDTRPVSWPNPKPGGCKCAEGLRTLAVHRYSDRWGKVVVDPYSAACPDCDLGRARKALQNLPDLWEAVAHYENTPGKLAVYADPRVDQMVPPEAPEKPKPNPVVEEALSQLRPQKPGNGSSVTKGAGAGRGAGGYTDDPSTRYEEDDDDPYR